MADEKKKGGKLKFIIIAVVVVITIGVIAGGQGKKSSDSGSASSEPAATTQAQTEKKEKYSISDESVTSDNYSYKISGILTNNTDAQVGYIQISYVLYDKDGNQLGTAFANTNNLKAGGTWKYEATGLGVEPSQVDHYELGEVTGFQFSCKYLLTAAPLIGAAVFMNQVTEYIAITYIVTACTLCTS